MKEVVSSHGKEHAQEVLTRALAINKELLLNADEKILELAAIYHDVAAMTNRKEHHIVGAQIFREENKNLPEELVEKVAQCIEQHRASYKGDYSSIEAKIISAADRGVIDEQQIDKLFSRAYSYSRENGESHVHAILSAYKHIKNKYGKMDMRSIRMTYSSSITKRILTDSGIS